MRRGVAMAAVSEHTAVLEKLLKNGLINCPCGSKNP